MPQSDECHGASRSCYLSFALFPGRDDLPAYSPIVQISPSLVRVLLQVHTQRHIRKSSGTGHLLFSTFCSLFFRLRIDCLRGNPIISGLRIA